MTAEVSPDGQFVSDLLGENTINWVRSAVGRSQSPTVSGLVRVGNIIHGTHRSNGSGTRSCKTIDYKLMEYLSRINHLPIIFISISLLMVLVNLRFLSLLDQSNFKG